MIKVNLATLIIFFMLGLGCISTKGSSAVRSPAMAPRSSFTWKRKNGKKTKKEYSKKVTARIIGEP